LEAGGVDYLTKPIVVDELLARMRVHLRNARRSELAHSALDATGRYMLSVGPDGEIHWATPQAARLLRSLGLALEHRLPAAIVSWLRGTDSQPLIHGVDGKRLELVQLGEMRAGERLLRLTLVEPDDSIERLRRHFALTAREAEVLLWIARGKSNKDISGVLQISPRTVNKHLEQVFQKLGVENRASAAAITVKALHPNS
jgi:DNA-binding CsgD family transcriptional regulator